MNSIHDPSGASLHTVLTKVIAAIQELDARTTASEKEIKSTKGIVAAHTSVQESLEERINDHHHRLADLENTSTKSKVDSEKLIGVEEELLVLEEKLRKTISDVGELKEKHVELEETLVNVDVEIHGLQDNHRHLQEEGAVVTKKISALRSQSEALERQFKASDREIKATQKEQPGAANHKELQKLEDQLDTIRKKRETDYRSLSHRIDQIASPNLEGDMKGLKRVLGELEGKYKGLHIATDKINRFDEQLKAFIKRHETDIVAVNMRIEDSQQQRPEDVVKVVTKRYERDVVELRRKVDMTLNNVASYKEDVGTDIIKMKEQLKVSSAKHDSKLRELVPRVQDLMNKVDDLQRAAPPQPEFDNKGKMDKLKHRYETNFKEMAGRIGETSARLEHLENTYNADTKGTLQGLKAMESRYAELKAAMNNAAHHHHAAYDDTKLRTALNSLETQVAENSKQTNRVLEETTDMKRHSSHITNIVADTQELVHKLEEKVIDMDHRGLDKYGTPNTTHTYSELVTTPTTSNTTSHYTPPQTRHMPTSATQQSSATTSQGDKPFIGVEVVEAKHRHSGDTSVYCKSVAPGGTFAQCGVTSGDIIITWNGKNISTKAEFGGCVESSVVGSAITLQVCRTTVTPENGQIQQMRTCKGTILGSAPSPVQAVATTTTSKAYTTTNPAPMMTSLA